MSSYGQKKRISEFSKWVHSVVPNLNGFFSSFIYKIHTYCLNRKKKSNFFLREDKIIKEKRNEKYLIRIVKICMYSAPCKNASSILNLPRPDQTGNIYILVNA